MGEIADTIINGQMCSWCGVFFEKPHDYPVACRSCWSGHKSDTKENDGQIHGATGIQKAIFEEL